MREELKQPMDRREFLRTLGRYAALAGMVAVGASLVTKKESVKDDCVLQTACGICPTLPSCGQNKAIDYRKLLGSRRR